MQQQLRIDTKYDIKLIHFKQEFGDSDLQAERLKDILIAENVIH